VFNAINVVWDGDAADGAAGYPDVPHGSSFVMAAHFVDPATNRGCGVDADAIVTYSQSEDVTRPFYKDQTRMYAEKVWNPMHFCENEIMSDPDLEVTVVRSRPAAAPSGPVSPAPAPTPAAPLPTTGGGLALAGLVLAVLGGAQRRR
jgi:hypothetical protein